MIRKSLAFTLVELMTAIVILGILATIAVPGYREYVYNAKLAEGYVGIAAISKAQITHFNEHKFFVSTQISPFMQACTPNGTKFPITASDNGSWERLGSPLVSGAENFFSYASSAAQWDNSVLEIGNVFSGMSGISFVCDEAPTKLFECDGYEDKVDPNLYASATANTSLSVIHATAHLKNNPPYCTIMVQSIIGDSSGSRLSPIISYKE